VEAEGEMVALWSRVSE